MRTAAGVAGSQERPSSGPANGWLDPQHLEFAGCDPLPVPREEIEGPEWEGRRVEYWHAATETAWVAREGATPFHEALPSALARILERVAMFRGSPIDCMGATDLRFHTPEGELLGFIQADQLVYLRPERTALLDAGEMVVGTSRFPDVVFEVDNTTDVRRNRLLLYERAGFPEVWVEVPDRRSRSARRSRRAGLTIHTPGNGGYRESGVSRVFPDWTAHEIHTALNEPVMSFETDLVLARVGRELGSREGGSPEGDPSLARFGREKHVEGHAAGIVAMAAATLHLRGIALSPDFPADLPREHQEALRRASAVAVAEAAHTAVSEDDFFVRLRKYG